MRYLKGCPKNCPLLPTPTVPTRFVRSDKQLRAIVPIHVAGTVVPTNVVNHRQSIPTMFIGTIVPTTFMGTTVPTTLEGTAVPTNLSEHTTIYNSAQAGGKVLIKEQYLTYSENVHPFYSTVDSKEKTIKGLHKVIFVGKIRRLHTNFDC